MKKAARGKKKEAKDEVMIGAWGKVSRDCRDIVLENDGTVMIFRSCGQGGGGGGWGGGWGGGGGRGVGLRVWGGGGGMGGPAEV